MRMNIEEGEKVKNGISFLNEIEIIGDDGRKISPQEFMDLTKMSADEILNQLRNEPRVIEAVKNFKTEKERPMNIDDICEEDKIEILNLMSFEGMSAQEFMQKYQKSASEILHKLKNNPKVIKAIERFENGKKIERLAIEEAGKKYGKELSLVELADKMPEEEKVVFFEKILENPKVLSMAIKHFGIQK